MTENLTRFDPSEYIDDAESQSDLLNEALATGNPRTIVHVIGVIARARGMTELSKATGIGRSSLYSAIADDANPTIETLMKVLDGLQIKLRATTSVAA